MVASGSKRKEYKARSMVASGSTEGDFGGEGCELSHTSCEGTNSVMLDAREDSQRVTSAEARQNSTEVVRLPQSTTLPFTEKNIVIPVDDELVLPNKGLISDGLAIIMSRASPVSTVNDKGKTLNGDGESQFGTEGSTSVGVEDEENESAEEFKLFDGGAKSVSSPPEASQIMRTEPNGDPVVEMTVPTTAATCTCLSQVSALAYKNLLHKKRSPVATFFEVFSPVLLSLILLAGYVLSDVYTLPQATYAQLNLELPGVWANLAMGALCNLLPRNSTLPFLRATCKYSSSDYTINSVTSSNVGSLLNSGDTFARLGWARSVLGGVLDQPLPIPTLPQYISLSNFLSNALINHTEYVELLQNSDIGRSWGNLLTLGTLHLCPSFDDGEGSEDAAREFVEYLEKQYPALMINQRNNTLKIRLHRDQQQALRYVEDHLDERTWAVIDFGTAGESAIVASRLSSPGRGGGRRRRRRHRHQRDDSTARAFPLEDKDNDVKYILRMNYTTLPNTHRIVDWTSTGLSDKYQRYFLSGYLTLMRVLQDFAFSRLNTLSSASNEDIVAHGGIDSENNEGVPVITARSAGGSGLKSESVSGSLAASPAPSKTRQHSAGVCTPPNQFNLWSAPMPTPRYHQNTFYIAAGYLLGLVLSMGFLYPASRFVKCVVEEKETRMKQTLQILGVEPIWYWASWAIMGYGLFFLDALLVTSSLKSTVLKHSSFGYLLLFMTLFCFSVVSFAFFIASFFSKAKLAAIMGPVALFATLLPRFIFFESNRYENTSGKIIASLFPCSAFAFGADIVSSYEYAEIGIWRFNLTEGDYSMATCMVMLAIDTVLYCVLGWYLDLVLPSQYGVARPWYFCFTVGYWGRCVPLRYFCGKENRDEGERVGMEGDTRAGDTADMGCQDLLVKHLQKGVSPSSRDFEEVGPGLNPRVEIQKLVKRYNKNSANAVDGLQLKLFENQITCLLGHNGAGKTTTISVVTGLYPPTSGDCIIYNHPVTSELQEARRSMGICPQHDVLFPHLTVYEHIWVFERIKGRILRSTSTELNIRNRAKDVGLGDKLHTRIGALSGGMKRKLSVAIALCGDPKFLLLDEPTSGMDPYSRRATWDLLRRKKAGRVTLLTTHFMDEAEFLADRVAVMQSGRLRCCGSPPFLKRRFGLGYRLSVVVNNQQQTNDMKKNSTDPKMITENASGAKVASTAAPVVVDGTSFDESPTPPVPSSSSCTSASTVTVSSEQIQAIETFLRVYIPNVALIRQSGKELTFRFPVTTASKDIGAPARRGGLTALTTTSIFPELFDAFESVRDDLGVVGYGISNTSLEEVFLRLAEDGFEKCDDNDPTDVIPGDSEEYKAKIVFQNDKKPNAMKNAYAKVKFWNGSVTLSGSQPYITDIGMPSEGAKEVSLAVTSAETASKKAVGVDQAGVIEDLSRHAKKKNELIEREEQVQEEREHERYSHLKRRHQIILLLQKRFMVQRRDLKGAFFIIVLPVLLIALVLLFLTIEVPLAGPPLELSLDMFQDTSKKGTEILVGSGDGADTTYYTKYLMTAMKDEYPRVEWTLYKNVTSSLQMSNDFLEFYYGSGNGSGSARHHNKGRFGSYVLDDEISFNVIVDWDDVWKILFGPSKTNSSHVGLTLSALVNDIFDSAGENDNCRLSRNLLSRYYNSKMKDTDFVTQMIYNTRNSKLRSAEIIMEAFSDFVYSVLRDAAKIETFVRTLVSTMSIDHWLTHQFILREMNASYFINLLNSAAQSTVQEEGTRITFEEFVFGVLDDVSDNFNQLVDDVQSVGRNNSIVEYDDELVSWTFDKLSSFMNHTFPNVSVDVRHVFESLLEGNATSLMILVNDIDGASQHNYLTQITDGEGMSHFLTPIEGVDDIINVISVFVNTTYPSVTVNVPLVYSSLMDGNLTLFWNFMRDIMSSSSSVQILDDYLVLEGTNSNVTVEELSKMLTFLIANADNKRSDGVHSIFVMLLLNDVINFVLEKTDVFPTLTLAEKMMIRRHSFLLQYSLLEKNETLFNFLLHDMMEHYYMDGLMNTTLTGNETLKDFQLLLEGNATAFFSHILQGVESQPARNGTYILAHLLEIFDPTLSNEIGISDNSNNKGTILMLMDAAFAFFEDEGILPNTTDTSKYSSLTGYFLEQNATMFYNALLDVIYPNMKEMDITYLEDYTVNISLLVESFLEGNATSFLNVLLGDKESRLSEGNLTSIELVLQRLFPNRTHDLFDINQYLEDVYMMLETTFKNVSTRLEEKYSDAITGIDDLLSVLLKSLGNVNILDFLPNGKRIYPIPIPSEVTILHNSSSAHAVAAFHQAYMQYRYQQCAATTASSSRNEGDEDTTKPRRPQFVMVNHPLPLTSQQSIEVKTSLSILASLFILIPYCFIPAAFIVFHVKERVCKSKHVQLVSGVDLFAFWISHYTWDFIMYSILTILIMCVFAFYGKEAAQVFVGNAQSFFCTYLLTLGYGFCSLPFAYLLSRNFQNHSSAQIAVLGIFFLTGFVAVCAYFIMSTMEKTKHVAEIVRYIFRLFPAYNVGDGFVKLSQGFFQREIFGMDKSPFAWDVTGESLALLYGLSVVFFILLLFLEYSEDGGSGGILGKKLRQVKNSIDRKLLQLQGFEANSHVLDVADQKNETKDQEDDDVAEERRRVDYNKVELQHSAAVLLVKLWKIYPGSKGLVKTLLSVVKERICCCCCCCSRKNGTTSDEDQSVLPKKAVRGLTTAVHKGETFGLLGMNGAGKSTTLAVLTGDITPTSGDAYVAGYDVSGDGSGGVARARKRIGFCPQVDPLLDLMTGREALTMFGRLRGIPRAQLDDTVNVLIDALSLTPYADRPAEGYSGGNKRKLSLGVALIGNPEVLFIDEASSSMDPSSRRKMWDLISSVSQNRSVVLTTHSMEEAEALCTRLTIMVDGQMRCLGSVQQLKTAHLDGYTLDLQLESCATRDVVEAARRHVLEIILPGSALVEEYSRFLRFSVPSRRWGDGGKSEGLGFGLGDIFRVLEGMKGDHGWMLEDYALSQCTLEQVFITFAKAGERVNERVQPT